MDELKDVIEAPSTSDAKTESSPVEQVAPVETPTQQVEQKEVPFNEHPRWKEVQEEKRLARQEAEYLRQQNLQLMELAKGFQPKEATVDPYADMTPEEKVFFQRVRETARQEAKAEAEALRKTYDTYIQKYEHDTVKSVYEEFKSRNPDVTPEEELAMAKIAGPLRQAGKSAKEALDIASKSILYEKLVQKTEQQKKVQTTQKTQQKQEANLETTTVSSALPTKNPKETVREFGARMLKEGKFSF